MRSLVIGGGIGGLAAGHALSRAGIDVTVFERAAALEHVQVGGAIHVWHNGMRGLERLGLADAVAALGGRDSAVERAEIRSSGGRLLTAWSVSEVERDVGAPTVGVTRPALLGVLAGGLDEGVLATGRECIGYEQDDDGVVARFADGGEERGDVLIGADGLRSTVRRAMLGPEELRFARYASWQALVAHRDEATPPGLFRAVWGPGARFLFYRVGSEMLYWEGIFATSAGGADPPGGRREAVLERFRGWHHPVESIIEATGEEAIARGDVYDRPPASRWGEGRVTLLGDAVHPMTNAVGQGANQTIEDAVVIGDCLRGAEEDPRAALREYERRRAKRADGTARLAARMSALSCVENPLAVPLRDAFLTVMMALVGKRGQRKDMAYKL